MRVNHNIAAIRANSILKKNNTALDLSTERLSSGYKINHAADDAAGMAISRKMHTQIEGLDQASRNASDGISVIQTAEGALNEVEGMLQRIRELSVQAANDTNTLEDRVAIQKEIDGLMDEIDRISNDTEFNTKSLLDGNVDRQSYSSSSNVEVISVSDSVYITDYRIDVLTDARQAVVTGMAFGGADDVIGASGTLKINNVNISVSSNMTYGELYETIRNTCDLMDVQVFPNSGDGDNPSTAFYEAGGVGDGDLTFVTRGYGSSKRIDIYCEGEELRDTLGIAETGVKATGVDAVVSLSTDAETSGFSVTATANSVGDIVTITDRDDFEMKIRVTPGAADTSYTDATVSSPQEEPSAGGGLTDVLLTVLDAGPMELQVGANENQTVTVSIPKTDTVSIGISGLNVTTTHSAQEAITLADNAIQLVSSIRAKLGAYQNRLEHTISNLDTSNENITESLSRIEDTDMAKEMTIYTQKNVLTQAGVSMLAQANERPQTVLSLIQG